MVTQTQIEAFIEEMRRAADGSDEWSERCERLRKRLAPRSPSPTYLVTELRREYEEATGTCVGCD